MNALLGSSKENVITKKGPNLSCNEDSFKALKWLGINGVTLANNHFYDYGESGVSQTLDICEKYVVDHVGGGRNLVEASAVLYKEIGGEKLAIVNCCEHEFSIASDKKGGANPIDVVNQYRAIQEARNNADFVVVIVHGGYEHYQLPSCRMVELYRFFVDAGASAVVNHHQHCFSSYEWYNGCPIYYGLGNFCFDISPVRTAEKWNYGYMVMLDLNKIKI